VLPLTPHSHTSMANLHMASSNPINNTDRSQLMDSILQDQHFQPLAHRSVRRISSKIIISLTIFLLLVRPHRFEVI
jgi:hypothetical protein